MTNPDVKYYNGEFEVDAKFSLGTELRSHMGEWEWD